MRGCQRWEAACGGWTVSRWLGMSFRSPEAAVSGMSRLRGVLGPLYGTARSGESQ